MATQQPSLLPPSDSTFGEASPSGLTPGTRSEAEAAFELNALKQTDSAAPDPSLAEEAAAAQQHAAGSSRRPEVPRATSFSYENALRRIQQQSSVSSDISVNTTEGEDGAVPVGSPATTTSTSAGAGAVRFPPPGQGVVPLNYGHVGAPVHEGRVKKTRSGGLSLGELGRQQSWCEDDLADGPRVGGEGKQGD